MAFKQITLAILIGLSIRTYASTQQLVDQVLESEVSGEITAHKKVTCVCDRIDVDTLMSSENKQYWSKHYAASKRQTQQSSFAAFIFSNFIEEKGIKTITEFGCGDGRDSYYFAKGGLEVVATDYAESAIAINSELNDLSNLHFLVMDVSNTKAMNTLKPSDAYYARFFLHALPQFARDSFIEWLGSIPTDAKVFLEFRTEKDPLKEKSDSFSAAIKKTSHFRRFESLESVTSCFTAKNFEVLFENESAGLSAVGDDDPVLARLILRKL